MRLFIAVLITGFFCTTVQSIPTRSSHITTSSKVIDESTNPPVTQSKRDISLSYAATDIDSKNGTRFKTITVIKNLGDNKNKNQPLAINPELHKNEEWATAFRDNFDSFGKLPDVPSIDDLFEFMHKKNAKEKGDEKPTVATSTTKKPIPSPPPTTSKPKSNERPVKEESTETLSVDEGPVEKIKGDAEFLPSNSSKRSSNRKTATNKSQSILVEKYQVHEPLLVDLNYSTPDHSVRQYSEKYVQQSSNGIGYTTTQRAYVAPNLRNNGLGIPYGRPAVNSYRGNYNTNAYAIGGSRFNSGRSRGLKY